MSPFSSLTKKPGRELPRATEIRFASTANEMIAGIEAGLNQLLAIIEGEFNMKIFPMAASRDPNRHQKTCWS